MTALAPKYHNHKPSPSPQKHTYADGETWMTPSVSLEEKSASPQFQNNDSIAFPNFGRGFKISMSSFSSILE